MGLLARTVRRGGVAVSILGIVLPAAAPAHSAAASSQARKLTIYGHRGAAGYRPEHTIGSYQLAAQWAPTTSSPTS